MRLQHLILASLLVAGAPAWAQSASSAQSLPPLPDLSRVIDVDPLVGAAQEAISVKDWGRLEQITRRLTELRPHNGNFALEHAASIALQGDRTRAYDLLLRLNETGWGFDLADDPRFDKIKGTEVWDFIAERSAQVLTPQGQGAVALSLPADDLMLEALTFDPTRKEFLLGAVRQPTIFRLADGGKLEPLIKGDADNHLWGVYDMAVDAKRDRLWVATMASAMTDDIAGQDYGRAAVLAFKLSDGSFVSRHQPPADGRNYLFPALAIAPDGAVFVADSLNRSVWKVEGEALRLVAENPRLSRVRGLTVSSDGEVLYFADYNGGLFGVELATGTPFVVGVAKGVSLSGIESLYTFGKRLVAVQNAMTPPRIVLLDLSPDGRNVARTLVVDSGQAQFTGLTRGVVVGDAFNVIANTQRGKYTPLGRLAQGLELEPLKIWRATLDAPLEAPRAPLIAPGG